MHRDFQCMYFIWVFLLFIITNVLWGLSLLYNPHLDGVAIYRMTSTMPIDSMTNKFMISGNSNRSKNTFLTEALMMPHCVFPLVYDRLVNVNRNSISTLLQDLQLLNMNDASEVQATWNKIDFDTWNNPFEITNLPNKLLNVPYNLPFDGLDASSLLNPQYFSPVCRCINQVLDIYSKGKGTFETTTNSIKACMGTRHIIQKQILVGSDDPKSADITARKFISRHALLFNLCTAIFFTMMYNFIDFGVGGSNADFFSRNWYKFLGLLLSFAIPYVSQTFSAASVAPNNSMVFSSLVYLPAAVIFLAVEVMWSHVAKLQDVRRQTYLHPYSFFVMLVNLYVLALIENGVFTLEIILTFVMMSIITSLAYAAVLFIAHGKLWKTVAGERNTSELTGYILILFLIGLTNVFHYIPVHPTNSELNFLWILPMVFVMFCFTQVVFLEHLMGEDLDSEDNVPLDVVVNDVNSNGVESQPAGINSISPEKIKKNRKLEFTNSVHLLNLGHTVIIALVIMYFAMRLHYSWYGSLSFTETGGKLDRRVNFELSELAATLSYNNVGSPAEFRST
jgi:hypothetical protein